MEILIRIITKFLKNLQENKPLEIFGDGNQSRDFIHIDDAVRCINSTIKNLEGKSGRVYNIGSGTSTSILQLANLLLKLTEKEIQIQFKPEINGDIVHSQTSIDLAKNDLDFKPKISLEDGLSRFLEDFI